MFIKSVFCAFSGALLLFSAGGMAAVDTQECNDCHGKDGISSEPTIPSIAGISEISLQDQLFAYLDGRHSNKVNYISGDTSRPATDMSAVVADMSEEQVEELAAHYSAFAFVPAKQPFDANQATLGEKLHLKSCEKCHSEGGSLLDDDASILAGQWRPYLRVAMDEYIDGKREGESGMVKVLKVLKPEQLDALSHYYASQQ